MSFLIDTNIISELRKGERCDAAVAAWWAGVAEDDLWLSALVVGEIRKGVELARRRDPRKAEVLETWLSDVLSGFGDRVLPVDATVAEEWGRMNAIRSFMHYDLGYIDLEQRTLQTIDNPFGTRLSPMSQVQTVTHVSGSYIGVVAEGRGLTSNLLHLKALFSLSRITRRASFVCDRARRSPIR